MRNVNITFLDKYNPNQFGFILTMRNVNNKEEGSNESESKRFILTMRNVNLEVLYSI